MIVHVVDGTYELFRHYYAVPSSRDAPGWGAKSTAAVIARCLHLENIPESGRAWDVRVAGAERLARRLRPARDRALLFHTLATLKTDIPLFENVDDLRHLHPNG